jgi:hypothetical protein
VRNESIGCCMMYLTMICTHITLFVVDDFMRFNSLDGLVDDAIGLLEPRLRDSVVVEDKLAARVQNVRLVGGRRPYLC